MIGSFSGRSKQFGVHEALSQYIVLAQQSDIVLEPQRGRQ
jgi:hypothetical protein